LASTGYAPGRIRTTTEQAEASYARTRIRGTILDTVRKDYPYVHKRCPWTEILSERVETPDYIAEFFGITVADIVFGPLAAMKPSEFNITPDS
jgi:DNA-directed RNA polymerase specialized sigma subunit